MDKRVEFYRVDLKKTPKNKHFSLDMKNKIVVIKSGKEQKFKHSKTYNSKNYKFSKRTVVTVPNPGSPEISVADPKKIF